MCASTKKPNTAKTYRQKKQARLPRLAQFVSDLLNDANDAKSKCPVSFGVLEKALLDNPNVAGVLENIRQMAELNRNANAWDRVRHQHMLLARLPFLNHSILVCSL